MKLWDFSGYYERTSKATSCQKLAFHGKLTQLCFDDSNCTNPSKFRLLNSTQFITSGTESNLEGFVWSHQRKTGLESSSRDNLPHNAIVWPEGQMLFFQNIPTNSIISKIVFLRRHRFRTLWCENAGCE